MTDAPEGAVLHLAVVQRHAEQAVPRGENAGKTLRHANVVRAFATVPAGGGVLALDQPQDLLAGSAALVGYTPHDHADRRRASGYTPT